MFPGRESFLIILSLSIFKMITMDCHIEIQKTSMFEGR